MRPFLVLAMAMAAQAGSDISPGPGESEHLAGGDTTVFDETRNAFSFPARNILESHRASFFVGNSFFNQNWLVAPASTVARDGLGPLFNARSCSTCHFKDGRGRPPEPGEPMSTMLLRISMPGTNEHGSPRPEPIYGDQIQGDAVPGVRSEADVLVEYKDVEGAFADGERFTLRRPVYHVRNPGYGVLPTNLLKSPRVAPQLIGLGLLEAIPEHTLRSLSDPEDRNGDGISGRLNLVWDIATGSRKIGRFGWKAEQPNVRQHTAAAFRGDLGITSLLMPEENHTHAQLACVDIPSGGSPEISPRIFDDVVLYARLLGVPAQRRTGNSNLFHGKAVFQAIGCATCHVPTLVTGDSADFPELSRQTIHPYTDLLLHDMGERLSDNRPAYEAAGREWRTPPLWGLGLLPKVNGHTFLLHDGRARGFAEAILWHGGEAQDVREQFRRLSKHERQSLITFLESL